MAASSMGIFGKRVTMMIKLAMTLALGVLITTTAMAEESKSGMPSDVAAQAAQRCAKLGASYIVQTTCMQAERESYDKGHAAYQNSSVPYGPARAASKAAARGADKDPSWVDLCPPPRKMTERDGCR
jgi:hypothetical protein